jgi:hypothetical protein
MDEKTRTEIKQIARETIESSVEGHRNYLTQIFEKLIWALGIIAVTVIALFSFFVHGNYSDLKTTLTQDIKNIRDNADKEIKREVGYRMIQYRIVKDLQEQLNTLVETSVKNRVAKDETKKMIEDQIRLLSDKVLTSRQDEVLKETERRVKQSLDELSNETAEDIIKKVSLPKGSVLAFKRSECPIGWSDFKKGFGRVILGVGKGEGLTEKELMDIGGEEMHTLTIEELPSHRHPYGDRHYYDQKVGAPECQTPRGDGAGMCKDTPRKTGPSGGDTPHNNMPPFIALRYCIKL